LIQNYHYSTLNTATDAVCAQESQWC